MRIRISSEPFAPETEMASFVGARTDVGALASFIGYCRDATRGQHVTRLELEHYPGFTDAEIERLAHVVAARHCLIDLLVVHRVGVLHSGDPIVLVAALSDHRAAAFAAVETMMDYLKTDAPIWKHEDGPDGARWIEPTTEDRARRATHEGKSRP